MQIENKDFEYILTHYDSPTTLFYLDPPYLPSVRLTTKAYRHEMSLDDHQRLLKKINEVEGMVMLCGYSHPLYEEALQGWERHEKIVYCKSASLAGPEKNKYRKEVIWLNPEAARARQTPSADLAKSEPPGNPLPSRS